METKTNVKVKFSRNVYIKSVSGKKDRHKDRQTDRKTSPTILKINS